MDVVRRRWGEVVGVERLLENRVILVVARALLGGREFSDKDLGWGGLCAGRMRR